MIVISAKSACVSGSVIFGASCQVDVHTLEDSYLLKLKNDKVLNKLHLYTSEEDLINGIESKVAKQNDLDFFSDEKILNIITKQL